VRVIRLSLLLLVSSHAAFAQAIRIDGLSGSADNDYIGTFRGFALGASWLPYSAIPVGVRVEYSRSSHENEFQSTLCDVYWPLFTNCAEETVRSSGHTSAVSYALTFAPSFAGWTLGGAVGVDRLQLVSDARGEHTGRGTGSEYPADIEPGFGSIFKPNGSHRALWLGRRITPRFGVEAEYRSRTYNYEACATDVRTPFCSEYTSSEVRLRGTYHLR
jgi:hypothetical protein